jgi:hypothetical protein
MRSTLLVPVTCRWLTWASTCLPPPAMWASQQLPSAWPHCSQVRRARSPPSAACYSCCAVTAAEPHTPSSAAPLSVRQLLSSSVGTGPSQTPVHLAAQSGCTAMVLACHELASGGGLQLNPASSAGNGPSPLHLVVQGREPACAAALLQGSCKEACLAWFLSSSGGGPTPAQVFAAAAASRSRCCALICALRSLQMAEAAGWAQVNQLARQAVESLAKIHAS